MNKFIDYLKQQAYSNQTIQGTERKAKHYLRWLSKENIEPNEVIKSDVMGYIQHRRRKGINAPNLRNYLNAIRIYYNYLLDNQEIDKHPIPKIEIKGERSYQLYHILEPTELNALYNSLKSETELERRNKAIAGILIYQGVTTGEIQKLELNDLDLRKGEIEIPETKKSNGRILTLEPSQLIELYEYVNQVRAAILERKREPTNKLFINFYRGNQLETAFTEIHKRLKECNPRLKSLRHLRASVIVKWLRQYNLRQTQYFAGHRFISSTERYQQSEMQGLTEEINQFHPLG